MKDRKDLTIPVPGEVNDMIEGQLGYGDSKAGWVREAIYQRLEREGEDVSKFRDTGNPSQTMEAVLAD